MLCVPTASADVVKVPFALPLRLAVPRFVVPS